MSTRKQIRDNVTDRARETGIDSIVNDLINNTLDEIQAPGWAFSPRRQHHYLWNFNRKKTTLTTVANQEDYELQRDVDKIGLVRQTTSPMKLTQIPDKHFYRIIPNPTATGNPKFYRLWNEFGLSVELSTDDTITIVSSSASDTSQSISVNGEVDTTGRRRTDIISLNGTTGVDGTITFKTTKRIRISKSAATTGNITIKETTSGTTLLTLSPNETTARFKVISFYPIPSSDITINIEYYSRILHLFNDSDSPLIPEEWHWVVETGTLAKVYEYQKAETMQATTQRIYASGVQSMVQSDQAQFDLITKLRSIAEDRIKPGILEIADNTYVPFI